MPPTRAAARNTASGRCSSNQRATACWSRRSTTSRPAVRIWQSSLARRGTIAGVDTLFVDTPPAPGNLAADLGEGELDELAHRVRLAGRQHVIIRHILLQDHPHPLDEVAGMAPVPLRIEITEMQRALTPE